jgi:hypothetical protein
LADHNPSTFGALVGGEHGAALDSCAVESRPASLSAPSVFAAVSRAEKFFLSCSAFFSLEILRNSGAVALPPSAREQFFLAPSGTGRYAARAKGEGESQKRV